MTFTFAFPVSPMHGHLNFAVIVRFPACGTDVSGGLNFAFPAPPQVTVP